MAIQTNGSGLTADYRTEVINGEFMRSKSTGVVSPAIRRMVEDSEIEPPCVILDEEEKKEYLQSLGAHTPKGTSSPNFEQIEVLVQGVGALFVKAFITDANKKKILDAENPYELLKQIVTTKADMISEEHHDALVDQVALIILAE